MDEIVFQPERRFGLLFHVALIIVLIGAGAWGLWQAAQASIGPTFLLYLLPALLAVIGVPVLAYRAYAMQTAFYALERDGIHLRWGLRIEDIPMTSLQWIQAASETDLNIPLPWFRLPGAILGVRRLPGYGNLEFLASNSRKLVLIATAERIFAISPSNPSAFLHTFQRLTEMGSLTPRSARSVYPTFLLIRVWRSPAARFLLLLGGVLSLALLVWVSFTVPSRQEIHLGFQPDGSPGDLVPAVRLMLLPVLNTFFFLIDFLLGLFLFRSEEGQPLAYLLWGSAALTSGLFLIAVYFILQSG